MDTDRLIDQLFSKEYRAVVRSIRDECLSGLREDHQVSALHELAAPTNLSPVESARYFGSFLDNIGAPQHVSERFTGWVGQGGPGDWWNSKPLPVSPHEALIASLWQDESERNSARHFVETWNVPGMEGRIDTFLRRAAENGSKVAAGEMSKRDARDDLAAFMQQGAPADVAEGIGRWSENMRSAPGDALPVAPAVPLPLPLPMPAGPTREQLQAQIDQHLADMRSAPGSEGYRRYWADGGAAKYGEAFRALETADEAAT